MYAFKRQTKQKKNIHKHQQVEISPISNLSPAVIHFKILLGTALSLHMKGRLF